MARTRVAVLAGALRAVEQSGARRSTMAEVAVLGGVAKATVYNHFRTKTDVLAALVESEVAALGEECAQRAADAQGRDGLADALEHAAGRLSEHRALRRLAADEPGVLARLLVPGQGDGWVRAREAAGRVLRAAGRDAGEPSVELVLRFAASHLAWPTARPAAAAAAEALARGLAPERGPAPDVAAGAGDGADDAAPATPGGHGATGGAVTYGDGATGGRPVGTGLGWPG